jgi:hypothetical protein
MADRINCCIPYCRRTARADKHPTSEEIICGKCWRLISPATKARRRELAKRAKRVDRLLMRRAILTRPNIEISLIELERLFVAAQAKNWQQAKADATNGRAGIG